MRTLFSAVSLLGIIAATAFPAWAQTAQTPPRTPQEQIETQPAEPGEKDTVDSRRRPDYDPLGVRLGGFFLYPRAAITEVFRDNVTFSNSEKDSDLISVFSPGVQLKSNWNVHALNLFADMDLGRHVANTDEDFLDWRSGFDGRVDIDRSTNVTGGFTFAELHEERSSPDQTSAAEPVVYTRYGPKAAVNKRFNRLSMRLGGDLTYYNFDDVPSRSGAIINMDDRDRRETQGLLRLGYEIVPQYEAFVRGNVNQRSYDDRVDDGGVDRDSKGWEVVAGIALDLGGVTFGNIFAGYLSQDFDDRTLKTVDGLNFGGDITWNPTRLTTVKLAVTRTVEETTLSGAAGALSTRARLTVDHELLRNLILSAGAEYQNNDYEGITRQDDVISVGGGADYLLNRYLRLRFRYTYDLRESDVTGGDYKVNTVLLRLVTQY